MIFCFNLLLLNTEINMCKQVIEVKMKKYRISVNLSQIWPFQGSSKQLLDLIF